MPAQNYQQLTGPMISSPAHSCQHVDAMTAATTRLTRQDAAQRLQVSESTLDRMIRRGDLRVEREGHGSRYRIWVLLEEDPEQSPISKAEQSDENGDHSSDRIADNDDHSRNGSEHSDDHELAALRTEVRNLNDLAEYRGELLKDAEWRYQELLQQLKLSQETSAMLARALPAAPDSAESRPSRHHRWWPFGKK